MPTPLETELDEIADKIRTAKPEGTVIIGQAFKFIGALSKIATSEELQNLNNLKKYDDVMAKLGTLATDSKGNTYGDMVRKAFEESKTRIEKEGGPTVSKQDGPRV